MGWTSILFMHLDMTCACAWCFHMRNMFIQYTLNKYHYNHWLDIVWTQELFFSALPGSFQRNRKLPTLDQILILYTWILSQYVNLTVFCFEVLRLPAVIPFCIISPIEAWSFDFDILTLGLWNIIASLTTNSCHYFLVHSISAQLWYIAR